MYNIVSAERAAQLDGKEVSVKDFLASDWTDHVYLFPADYKKRIACMGVQVSTTRESSDKILREKYINNTGVYFIREKDFGDGVVSHWIYFNVIVPVKEYEEARKQMFGKFFGGK